MNVGYRIILKEECYSETFFLESILFNLAAMKFPASRTQFSSNCVQIFYNVTYHLFDFLNYIIFLETFQINHGESSNFNLILYFILS